jgi:Uma2 family endonuclease
MANQVTLKAITADEVLTREAQEQAGREIINGEWARETQVAGQKHGLIALRLIMQLGTYVEERGLGQVYPDNVNYVLKGSRNKIEIMRIPDISFVIEERVNRENEGFMYLAPDLAIEIVSPSETERDTSGKVQDYLRAGTQQVWVVKPDEQSVTVYVTEGSPAEYKDTVPGGELLPGFALEIPRLFV